MLLKLYVTFMPNCFGKFFIVLAVFLQVFSAYSKIIYVAPDGSDSNSGTSISTPFATIMRAQSAASSGDTVYLRGGTYFLDNSNLTLTNSAWAIVNNINKSGVSYIAYPGDDRPVFDFSAVRPNGWRVTAFLVTASSCVFKGFDIVGVQVTIPVSHTQSEYFRIASTSAKFNRFENLRMHDGMANGWYLTDGISNVVLNCDAYNNRGLDSGSIGNTDGFGCHPAHTSSKGNLIAGCRAWFNSDDGFDCINAFTVVTFSNCWAFYNGYFTNFSSSGGDGNGIKAGGYGVSGGSFPTPIPHHIVEHCLTVSNRVSGFYANHHLDGQIWLNNTAYRNSVNYNMLCNTNNTSGTNDCPGFNHVMKNNLSFSARSSELANINTSKCDVTYNWFTLPVSVSAGDFQSLDTTLLTAPRGSNGELPYIAFAQLVGTSDLLDVGTNVGFAFAGSAPDLGVFEYGLNPPPSLVMTQSEVNFIFISSSGPAGGTNYLIAATNLSLPTAQWTRIATNKFDLSGNVTMTNPIPFDLSQQFYRISLP